MDLQRLDPTEDLEIIDVREPAEWNAGRIEGARHIPLQTLPDRLGEIPSDKKVLVVCKSGVRSAHAAKFLRQHGFDAHNLDGGLKAWVRDGGSVEAPDGGPGRVI